MSQISQFHTILPLPLQSCDLWMFIKENPGRKKIYYDNIAWASTTPTKLKNILLKQKHAARIILYADRQTPTIPLLIEMKALNIY